MMQYKTKRMPKDLTGSPILNFLGITGCGFGLHVNNKSPFFLSRFNTEILHLSRNEGPPMSRICFHFYLRHCV